MVSLCGLSTWPFHVVFPTGSSGLLSTQKKKLPGLRLRPNWPGWLLSHSIGLNKPHVQGRFKGRGLYECEWRAVVFWEFQYNWFPKSTKWLLVDYSQEPGRKQMQWQATQTGSRNTGNTWAEPLLCPEAGTSPNLTEQVLGKAFRGNSMCL